MRFKTLQSLRIVYIAVTMSLQPRPATPQGTMDIKICWIRLNNDPVITYRGHAIVFALQLNRNICINVLANIS